MPKVTTPAEAHDATQVLPVRIPEQFPASPRMVAATIDNTAGTDIYDQVKGNVITFAEPLTAATTLNLTTDNFEHWSNLCVVKASATAAATLSIAVSDGLPVDIVFDANSDSTITLTFCEAADGNYEPVVLSLMSDNAAL